MQRDWIWVTGGGAGDVWWEYLHTIAPMRIKYLVEEYGCRIKVLASTHNPGSIDIFRHNPYLQEVVITPWHQPTPEDATYYNNPIDGYWPLHNNRYFFPEAGGCEVPLAPVELYLSEGEKRQLYQLLDQRPCIVAQPYAGLSDRDGYSPESLHSLVEELVKLERSVRVLVIGYNHDRTHKYSTESALDHPNVVNLIDKCSLRLSYFLTKYCDAFTGAHSNLIRAAWDHRRRNALILPAPSMTNHIGGMDSKYTYGLKHPESRTFTYPFGEGVERNLNALDTRGVAQFLLGRN